MKRKKNGYKQTRWKDIILQRLNKSLKRKGRTCKSAMQLGLGAGAEISHKLNKMCKGGNCET